MWLLFATDTLKPWLLRNKMRRNVWKINKDGYCNRQMESLLELVLITDCRDGKLSKRLLSWNILSIKKCIIFHFFISYIPLFIHLKVIFLCIRGMCYSFLMNTDKKSKLIEFYMKNIYGRKEYKFFFSIDLWILNEFETNRTWFHSNKNKWLKDQQKPGCHNTFSIRNMSLLTIHTTYLIAMRKLLTRHFKYIRRNVYCGCTVKFNIASGSFSERIRLIVQATYFYRKMIVWYLTIFALNINLLLPVKAGAYDYKKKEN